MFNRKKEQSYKIDLTQELPKYNHKPKPIGQILGKITIFCTILALVVWTIYWALYILPLYKN